MSFINQFLAGVAVAGTASYFFSSSIRSRTDQISSDLLLLSSRLKSLSPPLTSSSSSSSWIGERDGISRLGLGEQVKSRWNEEVMSALKGMRETRWDLVAHQGWNNATKVVGKLSQRISGGKGSSGNDGSGDQSQEDNK